MGKRRMLSADIIGSGKFTNMPQEAQLLYIQLNSAADDDGFIANPQMICFGLRFDASMLEVLVKNGYMIVFSEGVGVLVHWNVNNQIRKDRYQETYYHAEKNMLELDTYGVYHLKDTDMDTGMDTGMDTCGDKAEKNAETALPSAVDTQYNTSKGNISQYNVSEEREEKRAHGEYQNVFLTDKEFEELKSTYPDWNRMIENLSYKIQMRGYQYNDHMAVLKKWAEEDKMKPSYTPSPSLKENHISTRSSDTYSPRYDFEAIERKAFLNVHKQLDDEPPEEPDNDNVLFDNLGF